MRSAIYVTYKPTGKRHLTNHTERKTLCGKPLLIPARKYEWGDETTSGACCTCEKCYDLFARSVKIPAWPGGAS